MIVSDFLKTIFKTLSFIRCFLPWEEFSHGFLPRRSQQIPHPNGRRRLRDTSAARSWMRKWPICSLAFRWLLRRFFFGKKINWSYLGWWFQTHSCLGWWVESTNQLVSALWLLRWYIDGFCIILQDMRIRKMQTLGLKKTTLGIWQIIWINGFCATFFKRAPHVLFWLCLCRFSKKREDLGDEYLWGAGSSFDEDMASRTGSGGRCVSEIHLKIGWEEGKNQQFTCAFFQKIWCSSISLMIIILHVKVKTCGYQTVPPLIPRKETWFWCCCGVLWPR